MNSSPRFFIFLNDFEDEKVFVAGGHYDLEFACYLCDAIQQVLPFCAVGVGCFISQRSEFLTTSEVIPL